MSFYPDAWDRLREGRERRARARETGEYFFASYADDIPYSGRPPTPSVFDSWDSNPEATAYSSSYGPSRSGRRHPTFAERSSSRDDTGYDSDTDRLRERFGEGRSRRAYAPRPPSPPPPPRRGGYDFDADEVRSGSSTRRARRWVAAEEIRELDDKDPRGKQLPKAPYVYVATEDPDGTVVDDPFEDDRRGDEAPGGERRGPRRRSSEHGRGPYGDRSSGSYSGSFFYSASYGCSSDPSSSSYGRGTYGGFY